MTTNHEEILTCDHPGCAFEVARSNYSSLRSANRAITNHKRRVHEPNGTPPPDTSTPSNVEPTETIRYLSEVYHKQYGRGVVAEAPDESRTLLVNFSIAVPSGTGSHSNVQQIRVNLDSVTLNSRLLEEGGEFPAGADEGEHEEIASISVPGDQVGREEPDVVEGQASPRLTNTGDNERSISPDSAPTRDLPFDYRVPTWAVLCVGVGECGTKLVVSMNQTPSQFVSRNPVYYPVHCSAFDTHDAILSTLQNVRPEIKAYPIRADIEFSDYSDEEVPLAERQRQQNRVGVGGIPAAGYYAFKRMFNDDELTKLNESSTEASPLQGIDADYFELPLWRPGNQHARIGPHKEVRLGLEPSQNIDTGSIQTIGLITFNSARGGTGSGGVSWVHNFIQKRATAPGRVLTLGLSLNVSVLPESDEKRSKPQFSKHAIASFYRLSAAEVHGVILVSNQIMIDRFGANYTVINDAIREMLVPIIVSPTGKYILRDASPTIDQADIRRAVSNTVDGRRFTPGLCVIGFAEDRSWSNADAAAIVKSLAAEAVKNTSCEWKGRSDHRPTAYRAFFTAPQSFFGHDSLRLRQILQDELITEISRNPGRLTPGMGMGQGVLGSVSFQHFEHATSARLTVLLSNVEVPEFDALVREGLGGLPGIGSDEDGWDRIMKLRESEVEQLEREQLGETPAPNGNADLPGRGLPPIGI